MKVIYSSKFLDYETPGHPESPERISRIYKALKDLKNIEFVKPGKASEKDLLLVHTQELLSNVKHNSFSDPDTPNIAGIYENAILAAGAGIKASEIALSEKYAFSLARPPGHHAGRNFLGGFCYFNNLAVAVVKLIKRGIRVAILDIDVHHGNGTQDIFLDNEKVLFCSLHQIPLYPGTGFSSKENCYNYPLSPGSDWGVYKKELGKALKVLKGFKPDMLAVSLGFDTYKSDPLANIKLEIEDYQKIGTLIKDLGVLTFFVLEGGYSEDIDHCARKFMSVFV